MAGIEFTPELLKYIKIIYGNADLDERTLKQIHTTWLSNPEIIKNTARQKIAQSSMQQSPSGSLNVKSSNVPTQMTLRQQEIADDDLRGITKFSDAFREARNRGLKVFKWGKGVYGTQLATEVKNQSSSQQKAQPTQQVNLRPLPKPFKSYSGLPSKQGELTQGNAYIGYQVYNNRYPQAGESVSWSPDILSRKETQDIWVSRPTESQYGKENTKFVDNRGFSPYEIFSYKNNLKPAYYQQGGVMNNQEELKQAFIQFLAQKTGAKNQQELEAAIQQLGEQGLQQAYQEFMQMIQQQQVQAAKFGAKLNYIKSLRGQCPEGYEMKYFKSGGQLCKKCMKKQQESEKDNKPQNPIDEFKCGRKMKKKEQGGSVEFDKCGKKMKKKAEGGDINYDKCGSKMKKKSKKQEGGTFDPKTYSNAVLAKCGTKLKEAAKGMDMAKCGSKMKKAGGTVSTPNGTYSDSKGTKWKPKKS